MTIPTKREKRQREYNHNFVSHQQTSFSFHSLVSILSKHRTCPLHKRQNRARPLRALFFPSSLPSYFFFFPLYFFFFIVIPGVEKLATDVSFFSRSSPSSLPRSRSHSSSRPSPLASHLLSYRLFLCLPGNLAVVMRRSAQPLGWWGWKKGKEVTRGCVGGGHRG